MLFPNFLPDESALKALAHAIDQILGEAHPIAQALRMPGLDSDALKEIYAQIEALPTDQRRMLAAMVAQAVQSTPGMRH